MVKTGNQTIRLVSVKNDIFLEISKGKNVYAHDICLYCCVLQNAKGKFDGKSRTENTNHQIECVIYIVNNT